MKEIKSNRFLRKQAIYGRDLPVGDPGLPGNITERDIIGGPDQDISSKQTGETEIGNSLILYTYNYDYDDNNANNIKIIQVKNYDTGRTITDPNILYDLAERFEEEIRNDIEIKEEDSKIERSPDYNPFEE